MSRKTRYAQFADLHEYTASERRDADSNVPSQVSETDSEPDDVSCIHGGRGYYELSFYSDSTSPDDWKVFLKKLSKYHNYATIFISMEGRSVHYLIESGKHLENGNAVFHPFRVNPVEKPSGRFKGLFGFKFPRAENLFDFDSHEHVRKNRSIRLLILKVLLRPICTNAAFGRVLYSNGQSDVLVINDLASFLSFSMHETMDKQVRKVRTELRDSDVRLHLASKKGAIFYSRDVQFGIEDFDFFRHGLVVGQTGSGKSKFLELYTKGLINCRHTGDYSIVFLDPHGKVHESIKGPFSRSIDFKTEAVELFSNVGQPPASTEFTLMLFSAFLDVGGNPQLARLLKHSLYLLFSIHKMSLTNLSLLLTDTMARKQFVRECDNDMLRKFFDSEFMEFKTQKYDSTILPIVNLINEYNLLSSGIGEANQKSLGNLVDKNKVLFISTNPSELGRNMTKLIGGALIQQLFTLLQSGRIKKKIILIVDEFSLVQNPAMAQILSEARKFGLTVIAAQQYLGQVDLELLQSIQANVSNLFFFKLNRKDAEIAKKMMTIEISKVFERDKSFDEIEEKKLELLTESNPRECIFRVMQKGKFTRPVKACTVDADMVEVSHHEP
jgi:hypothetical protein